MTHRLLISAPLLLPTLCVAQTERLFTAEIPARRVTLPKETIQITLPSHPTADDLSKPGALAAYVAEKLKTGYTCYLPGGVITTDKPIDLYRVLGGRIEGVGMAPGDSNKPDGFRNAAVTVQAHTTIRYTGSGPAVRLRACQGLAIGHLTIEAQAVGISYEHVDGWPCNYLTLDKVAINAPIGFRAGEKTSDHNAADVTFTDCHFVRCQTGLEVNHNQGVNWRLYGCNFLHVETACHFRRGGLVHLLDCFGFVDGTWLSIQGGGPNAGTYRITNLNSDREPQQAPPVIVDASEAVDTVKVIVDGVKVTQQVGDGERFPGCVYYRQPKLGLIRVRDDDLNVYPVGRAT